MNFKRIAIVGGGAAGFFAAITAAEADPSAEVVIFEKRSDCLAKVRVSGGGRCNVTHACFTPRELSLHYPRGGRALIGLFGVFQPRDTIEWFAARGTPLKTEKDGRMFPITDSSDTIVDCLMRSAREAGVQTRFNAEVASIAKRPKGEFLLTITGGGEAVADRVLLATGGCGSGAQSVLAESLGHALEPPAPSLFTFNIESSWLRSLSGISVEPVEASVPGTRLRERGAALITHWGLSGPVILRLSAWGARLLRERDYRFTLLVNWLPGRSADDLARELSAQREQQAARLVINSPVAPLPSRLWEALAAEAGIARDTRWAALSKSGQHRLVQQLFRSELTVSGKCVNKEEFVTCGGVALAEVNLKTMESRICPGLFFAGEFLDIDGLTGGFNFQAAWTTGWIAGKGMAAGC